MDTIHIRQIRAYGYTGYLPEEQKLGQWFEVDLTLELDLMAAGQSDAIEDTLDYRQAIAIVKERIKTCKFALVERLAAEIATALLEQPLVQQVRVQLTKPNPPIPDFGGQIQIDITRNKGTVYSDP